MTNREKLKAMLADRSPNGEKALIEFMNEKFGCPPFSWDIDCSSYKCCDDCWKHYLESEVKE